MDVVRPDQLTPLARRPSDVLTRHEQDATSPHLLAQDEVRRRIIEIDSRLHLEEPRLAEQFRRLGDRVGASVALVVAFLAASALLLWFAVTSQTWQAGLAGVGGFLAALAIARGHGSSGPRAPRPPR